VLRAAPPETSMLVLSVELSIEDIRGTVDLCLPFAALKDGLDDFAGAHPVGLEGITGSAPVDATLLEASVELSLQFAPLTMTSDQILSLAIGDVILLHHPTDRPLALSASGVAVVGAVAGRRGRRLACRVVDSPKESLR
jgi:flagellar motor switch protein FliM